MSRRGGGGGRKKKKKSEGRILEGSMERKHP